MRGQRQRTTEEQAKTQDSRVEATPPQKGEDQAENPEGGGTEIPVKEETDWDARDDEAAITPPFLDEDAQHPGRWQDIPGPEGTRQPVTPELLVDLDEAPGDQQPSADDIVEGIKHTTIFHNMTVADIRKEWGMPMPASPSTSEASTREQREQEESTGSVPGASAGGDPPLDQDELVKQVMDELKQQSGGAPVQSSGGAQADREAELIDIEIDSGATEHGGTKEIVPHFVAGDT